jgi:hypothetical protein
MTSVSASFKNITQVNNHPIGENSPNRVTLDPAANFERLNNNKNCFDLEPTDGRKVSRKKKTFFLFADCGGVPPQQKETLDALIFLT